MSKLGIQQILRRVSGPRNLKKNLKFYALAGLLGAGLIFTLVLGAALSIVPSVLNQVQTANLLGQVENQIKSLPEIEIDSCWAKVQGLMDAEMLLTKPLAQSFEELKNACFEAKPLACQGSACEEVRTQKQGVESEEII